MVSDVQAGIDTNAIAAKFHNCIAAGLTEMAKAARQKFDLDTVALSGGVFCNRYLINRVIKLLKKEKFSVLFNHIVPANDGGIALGQAAIATKLVVRET